MESSAAARDAESRVEEESSTDQAPLSADGHKKKDCLLRCRESNAGKAESHGAKT